MSLLMSGIVVVIGVPSPWGIPNLSAGSCSDIAVVVVYIVVVVVSVIRWGGSPGRMVLNPSVGLVSLSLGSLPLEAFPTLPLGGVVLGCHLDVVRAVGMGLLKSSLSTPVLGSPLPDVVRVPPTALHPNFMPTRSLCSTRVRVAKYVSLSFDLYHCRIAAGVVECGLLWSSVSLLNGRAFGGAPTLLDRHRRCLLRWRWVGAVS